MSFSGHFVAILTFSSGLLVFVDGEEIHELS
jgi:hypothetical protein